MKKLISTTLITILCFIMACAAAPCAVKPMYISPIEYKNYSCKQIKQEYERLDKILNEINKKQRTSSNLDNISMGIGLVLFWPALLLIATTGDFSTELANIKGKHKAVEDIIINGKCGFAAEIKINKEKKEKEEEARKEAIKNRDW